MSADHQTRRRLRQEYTVTVRVRCDRCSRVVGTLHGDRDEPQEFTAGYVGDVLPRAYRIDYFRCSPRCLRAPYVVRWDKLVAAYRKVATRPEESQRVIWLLTDVRTSSNYPSRGPSEATIAGPE
jgi:hypothetical protein